MTVQGTGLTDAKIRGLKAPSSGRLEFPDRLVVGLRVRVGSSGAKTFILRKRVGGRTSNIALGRYHETRFTLADARRHARTLLSDIEAGREPRPAQRKVAARSTSVAAMYDEYWRAEAARKRSGPEIDRIFRRYILPVLGQRLADSVTRGEITRLIDEVARGGARETPVMARAVAAQLSAFYSWAMPRLDTLEQNPCRDAGKPKAPTPRDRVLSNEEIAALWRALDEEQLPWSAGVRLLLLTGQRRGEVFSAERSEFELESLTWTIPASRAKNGRPHLVPLSALAAEVIAGVPEIIGSNRLFPARSNLSNGASGFSKALARLNAAVRAQVGETEWFTFHDLRRTVATGLQRLGIRLDVTEAVLNHVSGSRGGLAAVYQRHHYTDEKRAALHLWAQDLLRTVARRSAGGNVIAIHG
ncbi:integrase [Sphingomonas sp. F9_3S_D5_B_2]